MEISAIILAAGASQRFGSEKLLHPVTLNGMTLPLAVHSLRPWLDTFLNLYVVVRPGAEMICDEVEMSLKDDQVAQINWIECADASQGMASSLVCGIQTNLAAEGWLIGLADMPAVPATAISGVRDALIAGADLAAPVMHGRRGHPAGFSSRYRDELLALHGDTGARHIMERDQSSMVAVNIDHAGIFADIDNPDDIGNLPG